MKPLTSLEVETYNSGASDHISPFQYHITSFQSIPLHPITAANQGTFNAIGKGDLQINTPDGNKSVLIILKDVFYLPEISLTLISVSNLLKDKKSILFEDDYCFIKEKGGKFIGKILEAANRLYKVEHAHALVSATISQEQVSIPTFHESLKHIPADYPHMLTHPDAVQVPQIIDLHSPILSDFSKSAKATCKPIAKEYKAPFTESLRDKVHHNTTQHNSTISFSHFLEGICSTIHSAGLHAILLESCISVKMLSRFTSESMLISHALEAHCAGHGFNCNPHAHHIHSPSQSKVNIKCNSNFAPSTTIVFQFPCPLPAVPSHTTSPTCPVPCPPNYGCFFMKSLWGHNFDTHTFWTLDPFALKGEWWNIGGAADISFTGPSFNASKYSLFFSYFTLSFYPFHCNCSKSDAHHLEAHLNHIFKQFTGSNSLQKHHTLFHQFACHFATKVFTSTLFLLLLYCNKTPIVLLMYLNTLV